MKGGDGSRGGLEKEGRTEALVVGGLASMEDCPLKEGRDRFG